MSNYQLKSNSHGEILLLTRTPSIIAITGYRIKPMLELDDEDLTYALGTIAVLASIVPLLGIINANLPVLPPAFKKVFKSSALGSTTNKKSTASGDGSKHQFSKLQEPEIPLVQVNCMNDYAPTSLLDKVETCETNYYCCSSLR